MASTVPAKSQPLHNFALTHLKWTNNHPRHRSSTGTRLSTSPSLSSPHDSPQRQSPLRQSLPFCGDIIPGSPSLTPPPRQSPMRLGSANDSAAPSRQESPIRGDAFCKLESSSKSNKPLIEYRRQSRNSLSRSVKTGESPHGRITSNEKPEHQSSEPESENKGRRSSSKFIIRIPWKNNEAPKEFKPQEEQIDDPEITGEEDPIRPVDEEEHIPKTWNFRPRNPIRKSLNVNGSGFKNIGSTGKEKGVYSAQVNPAANSTAAEKKEKRKKGFTITLTREEIEEDFLTLIGSKPTRRHKKRSRTTQRQLENLFPGAWLHSISADSYKVSENRSNI